MVTEVTPKLAGTAAQTMPLQQQQQRAASAEAGAAAKTGNNSTSSMSTSSNNGAGNCGSSSISSGYHSSGSGCGSNGDGDKSSSNETQQQPQPRRHQLHQQLPQPAWMNSGNNGGKTTVTPTATTATEATAAAAAVAATSAIINNKTSRQRRPGDRGRHEGRLGPRLAEGALQSSATSERAGDRSIDTEPGNRFRYVTECPSPSGRADMDGRGAESGAARRCR